MQNYYRTRTKKRRRVEGSRVAPRLRVPKSVILQLLFFLNFLRIGTSEAFFTTHPSIFSTRQQQQQRQQKLVALFSAIPKSNGASIPKQHLGTPRPSRKKHDDNKSAHAGTGLNSKTKSANNRTRSPPPPARPKHVAFVCDGNSRWARARGLPAIVGHAAGADRLIEVVRALQDDNNNKNHHDGSRGSSSIITHCTFFGFSTENWQRPAREIRDIWKVMERTVERCSARLLLRKGSGIVVRVVGDLDDERIPVTLRARLRRLERETAALQQEQQVQEANNKNSSSSNDEDATAPSPPLTLCLAINYGGRADIVAAARRIARLAADGALQADDVREATLAAHLCTCGIPDPDLIVRTSGETRLSNFLLWNAAYAELYFTEELWPDFGAASVQAALDWFSQRRRRFGGREFCDRDDDSVNNDSNEEKRQHGA